MSDVRIIPCEVCGGSAEIIIDNSTLNASATADKASDVSEPVNSNEGKS